MSTSRPHPAPRPDPQPAARTLPSFVGPASVLGACVGMVAWVAPYFFGSQALWTLALPAVGLLLVVLPVATLRHLGVGLLASVLVWPVTVIGVVALSGLLD